MRVLGVIPARLGSTRLPNKPLQLLAGEPLVTRVIQRVRPHRVWSTSWSWRPIRRWWPGSPNWQACGRCSPGGSHDSGTERVAEVAAQAEFAGYDVVVNIQGDEPFLPATALAGALERVAQGDDVGTAAAPLGPEDRRGPGAGEGRRPTLRGRALYFSRAAIPYRRERSVPPARSLLAARGRLRLSPRGPRSLDQSSAGAGGAGGTTGAASGAALRHDVGVARLNDPAQPGVDTPDDLRRAEAHWLAQEEH